MIETKDLTKTFDNFTAVDSLNLKIEKGEFFGLLGPNGAGKTTTISLLSTLLLPTKGEILIDGQQLTRQRPDLKRKISVITQEYSMRQDMNMDEIHVMGKCSLSGEIFIRSRLMVVVLPAPFGPRRPKNSPFSIFRFRESTAVDRKSVV